MQLFQSVLSWIFQNSLMIGEFSLYISVVSGTLFYDFTALSFFNSSFISLIQDDHRASLVLHHSLKTFSRQQAGTIIDLTLLVSKFLRNHCPFFLALMTWVQLFHIYIFKYKYKYIYIYICIYIYIFKFFRHGENFILLLLFIT